jgi:transposase
MCMLSTLPSALLPATDALHLEALTVVPEQITATLVATRPVVPCPVCGVGSRRIHSHYARTRTDLPWGQHRVRLQLSVRKFRCATPTCPRRIFTERLPDVVAPYARRTLRLTEVLSLLAVARGGEAGSRVVTRLQLATSPATLLRLIRRLPLPESPAPRVLGIDDFAFRKGRTYGTILVDLERRAVVDLLPERSAETVITWLERHPAITIISRDRAHAYTEAATTAAPQAQQVADRWHLLHNLVEAVESVLLQKRPLLRAAVMAGETPSTATPPVEVDISPGPLTPRRPRLGLQRMAEVQRQRHARLVEQYETIQRLAAAGATTKAIARQVGVSRGTVARYRALPAPPDPKRPHRPPQQRVLTPYEPYLLWRWQEGCHTGMRLYRELRECGYPYGASTVMRLVAALRREEAAGQPTGTTARVRTAPIPTARHVAALFLRRPQELDAEDQTYVQRLQDQDADVAAVYNLTQAFARMARERGGARLDTWLAEAEACAAPPIQRFARGLRTDDAAVRAGLTAPWSNGQTEGQVNKLKLIKRQMYGRAGFELLRQRVLRAA